MIPTAALLVVPIVLISACCVVIILVGLAGIVSDWVYGSCPSDRELAVEIRACRARNIREVAFMKGMEARGFYGLGGKVTEETHPELFAAVRSAYGGGA